MTLFALDNCKLHPAAFFKRAIASATDRAVVDEDVSSTVTGNEAITFGSVEPFDCAGFTLCHGYSTSFLFQN